MAKKATPTVEPASFSMKEAAAYANTDRNYLLKLIKNGRIAAEKVESDRGTQVWSIDKASLDEWMATKGQRGARSADGTLKYFVYMSDQTREAVVVLVRDQLGIELEFKRPHYRKPKWEPKGSKLNDNASTLEELVS
jgi:excisionase family DNA binding protein